MHPLATHQNTGFGEFFREVIFLAVRAVKPRPSPPIRAARLNHSALLGITICRRLTGRLRPPACSVVVSVHAEPVLLSPPLSAEKLWPLQGPAIRFFTEVSSSMLRRAKSQQGNWQTRPPCWTRPCPRADERLPLLLEYWPLAIILSSERTRRKQYHRQRFQGAPRGGFLAQHPTQTLYQPVRPAMYSRPKPPFQGEGYVQQLIIKGC
ncbi:unnamed protein product [Arctia plantaginis]|uniref:Uncharacterized protein n=1 Tax=Arctia plantaginis TaxID=874455 RepID=A0A8S0ZPZ4_ARCPL|nr:unnamed protein product [Arctia plantaginis]